MQYLVAFTLFFAGCAGSDVLPQVGGALNQARLGLVATDQALAKVSLLVHAVCAPEVVVPIAVPVCGGAYETLDAAERANDVAREGFSAAQQVYDAANAEATK